MHSYQKKYLFLLWCTITSAHTMNAYHLPYLNFGLNNILDGGPIRESSGWYWMQYSRYYHADRFVNECGGNLGGMHSPTLDTWATLFQFVYQSQRRIFPKTRGGIDIGLPFFLYSHVQPNCLGIATSGAGIGDLNTGVYAQFDPVMHHDRPLFVHRIEL